MRIAFFSSYPPDNDGIAKYTKRIIDHFPQGNELIIFAKREKLLSELPGIYRTISFSPADLYRSCKKLFKFRPEIIHIQYTIPLYGLYVVFLWPLLWLAKILIKSKIVITCHEVKRETDLLGLAGRVYFFVIALLANRLYVHTNQAKEILIGKCRVKESKVVVIPHGTFSFDSLVSKEELIRKNYAVQKQNIVLFLGYIHIDKGIEYLVEAFNLLLGRQAALTEKTQLLIVGSVRPRKGIFRFFGRWDRLYFDKIKQQIKQSAVRENITLIDYVPDELIYSFLKMSRCIVLPYTNGEQSGILNLAISAQTPVVASNIGGIGETLKDIGVLTAPRDSVAIAAALEKIILEPDYAWGLAERYASLNEELQPGQIVNLLVKDYRQLL